MWGKTCGTAMQPDHPILLLVIVIFHVVRDLGTKQERSTALTILFHVASWVNSKDFELGQMIWGSHLTHVVFP